MKTKATIILCALALTACNPPANVEREFVCETGGALSERHVGVYIARHQQNGTWWIRYVEGGEAIYVQQPGEACTLEEYEKPTNGS